MNTAAVKTGLPLESVFEGKLIEKQEAANGLFRTKNPGRHNIGNTKVYAYEWSVLGRVGFVALEEVQRSVREGWSKRERERERE